MKTLPILAAISGIATLVTACSSAAPRAPLGLDKRPANGPETVAQLTRAPEPNEIRVAPQPTVETGRTAGIQLSKAVQTPASLERTSKMTVSDYNAPMGVASLPDAEHRQLLIAAKAAEAITLYARTDQWTRTPASTEAAVARGVRLKRYLISQGVPESKIRIMYRSSGGFVTPNRTPQERAMNRRVDIAFG